MADNAIARPKAVFIGPATVGDALKTLRPGWDFLPHAPDINTFRARIDKGTIDRFIQIVLIVDKFFDPQARDASFERLIARLSPHCFFGIVNYNVDNNESILQRVQHERYQGSHPDSQIFFIDRFNPNRSLDESVMTFIDNADENSEEAACILAGKDISEIENRYEEASPIIEAVQSDTLGQVVTVTSSKGGSGKSTIAISLSTYLAHASINSVREGLEEKPLNVVILDLDVRDGQLGFFTGAIEPSVLKIKRYGVSEDVIIDTAIYDEGLKVDLLLAPRSPRAAEELPPDFYVDLIQTLRTMYDYVIIDTSVNYLDPLLEEVAYPIADQIVMVTEFVRPSVLSMGRWIQEVTEPRERNGMNIPKRKIGIVVNKSLSSVNLNKKTIVDIAQNVPIITVVPSNQPLIAHATNVNSMELVLEHEKLRESIQRLAEAIVGNKYTLSQNVTP